jgi:hypothetical protein
MNPARSAICSARDPEFKPLAGFDYANCVPIKGDSVAQEVKWNGKSMTELKGKPVRIEFQLQNADLFTFRAAGE